MFDKLLQVLVFGCGYGRVADRTCSARTLRRRRDEWPAAGVAEQLHQLAVAAYDRMIGLELDHLAVEGCTTKAPCGGQAAGRNPVDRGKHATKRSLVVDGAGVPLGVLAAPANQRHDGLLAATLDTLEALGPCPSNRPRTWTPATTTSPAGTSWPPEAWPGRSPRAGCQRRSKPAAGRSWNAPTPG